MLGGALTETGQFDEAIPCFRKAIELYPNLLEAHFNLGLALQRQGKLTEAVACFRKAIELQPRLANTHCQLGTVLVHQGKVDEAIACYRKAIELDPKNADFLNALAWQLATCADLKFRNPAEAVKLAETSSRLVPEDGNKWNTLGAARYRAGDWKGAIEALNQSMRLRKRGDANDWFFLAMAHQRLNRKEEARQWYDRAVQWMDRHAPKDEELRRFRTEAEEVLGTKLKQ
jgi:tetratricopeptide (TPR) repeat protein